MKKKNEYLPRLFITKRRNTLSTWRLEPESWGRTQPARSSTTLPRTVRWGEICPLQVSSMSPVLGLPVLPSTGRPAGPATPHSQGQQRRHRPSWWVSYQACFCQIFCLYFWMNLYDFNLINLTNVKAMLKFPSTTSGWQKPEICMWKVSRQYN